MQDIHGGNFTAHFVKIKGETSYQYFIRWFGYCGEDVDTLGREVPGLTSADTLTIAPAGRHDGLPGLLVQHD